MAAGTTEVTEEMRQKARVWLETNAWPEPDYHYYYYQVFHYFQRWYKFFSKIFVKQKDGTTKLRYNYPLQVLPFVNTAYDLFFDDSKIKHESVRALLDILGLINALLLGSAISIFTALDFDELVQADERFGFGDTPPVHAGYFEYWKVSVYGSAGAADASASELKYIRPSSYFFNNVSRSVSLYFINVIVVVYIYVDMVSKMPDSDEDVAKKKAAAASGKESVNASVDDKKGGAKDVTNAENVMKVEKAALTNEISFEDNSNENVSTIMFEAWWAYARVGVFLCLFSTILGLYYAIWSVRGVAYVKFPDVWVEEHSGAFPSNGEHSPFLFLTQFFFSCGAVIIGTAIFSCGFGTTYRYSVEDDRKYGQALQKILAKYKKNWEKYNSDSQAKNPMDRNLAGEEYAYALKQAFFFCVAIDDWVNAHAILVSIKTSGLLEFGTIVKFIHKISKTGDVVHGISRHADNDDVEALVGQLLSKGELLGSSSTSVRTISQVAPTKFEESEAPPN